MLILLFSILQLFHAISYVILVYSALFYRFGEVLDNSYGGAQAGAAIAVGEMKFSHAKWTIESCFVAWRPAGGFFKMWMC